MKVLATGFGPFPGVPQNVSSDLAAHCAQSWNDRPDIAAEHLVLATDWHTAPTIAAAYIAKAQPDIIIHLGVSAKATGLVLESHAYNACCDMPDVDGALAPDHERHTGHPAHICSALPIDDIANKLVAAGHKVITSDDPGRYLCNAVYHETLTQIADTRSNVPTHAHAIFIHIPAILGPDTITFEQASAGFNAIFDELIRH